MSSFQDYIEYPTYDSTKAKVSTRSQEIQSHGSSSSGDDAHPTDRPERMREWIIRMINSGRFPGLEWLNEEKDIFRVPWIHTKKRGYCRKRDTSIFREWAIHSGKYREDGDPTTWKINFRCAINGVKDIMEVKGMQQEDCRVYKMLPSRSQSKRRSARYEPYPASCTALTYSGLSDSVVDVRHSYSQNTPIMSQQHSPVMTKCIVDMPSPASVSSNASPTLADSLADSLDELASNPSSSLIPGSCPPPANEVQIHVFYGTIPVLSKTVDCSYGCRIYANGDPSQIHEKDTEMRTRCFVPSNAHNICLPTNHAHPSACEIFDAMKRGVLIESQNGNVYVTPLCRTMVYCGNSSSSTPVLLEKEQSTQVFDYNSHFRPALERYALIPGKSPSPYFILSLGQTWGSGRHVTENLVSIIITHSQAKHEIEAIGCTQLITKDLLIDMPDQLDITEMDLEAEEFFSKYQDMTDSHSLTSSFDQKPRKQEQNPKSDIIPWRRHDSPDSGIGSGPRKIHELQPSVKLNLPGVDVVGQTSLVVTSSAQTFQWTGYGFNLHVPMDSLPADVDHCILYMYASISGQYEFPDNQELVSAIYWVRCVPSCQFKRPLTAEFQHCAKKDYCNNLTFVRAFCSQKILPYTFKIVEGCGTFTDESSYGIIHLNHFSGWAVTGEGPIERLYTASLYYLGRDVCTWEIHLVVTWDDEPHVTSIRQHYKEKDAVEGPFLSIEFEGEKIELNIPMEGIPIGEWRIRPLILPMLAQKRVDYFKPGRQIPCCQLTAKFIQQGATPDPVPELYHLLSLKGAKEPNNVITIEIDPTMTQREHARTSVVCLATSSNACGPTLTLDQLLCHTGITEERIDQECTNDNLSKIAPHLTNWLKYGKALRLTDLEIQEIHTNLLLDATMKAHKVLQRWHQANSFQATYRRLIEVCLEHRDVIVAKEICKLLN